VTTADSDRTEIMPLALGLTATLHLRTAKKVRQRANQTPVSDDQPELDQETA
jgi:hypothetical protein